MKRLVEGRVFMRKVLGKRGRNTKIRAGTPSSALRCTRVQHHPIPPHQHHHPPPLVVIEPVVVKYIPTYLYSSTNHTVEWHDRTLFAVMFCCQLSSFDQQAWFDFLLPSFTVSSMA